MKVLVALAAILSVCSSQTWAPRELGKFSLSHAGFVEVFTEEDGTEYLYITTFNAGSN